MVCRVQLRVKFGIGRFNAQQVAVGTRLAPAAVRFLALLSKAYGHAEVVAAECMDAPQHVLDEGHARLARQFAGLEHEAAIPCLEGPFGLTDNLLRVHAVAMYLAVALPDSAVVAVLLADVREFHQPPKGNNPSNLAAFHLVCGGEKCIRIRPGQKLGQFPMRQRTRRSDRFVQQQRHCAISILVRYSEGRTCDARRGSSPRSHPTFQDAAPLP